MGYIHLLLLACVAVGHLVSPTVGLADLGPLNVTGGAASLKAPHESIRLDLQDVTIRLKKASYVVDATFCFFNTGKETTEWVGFPKRGDGSDLIRFDSWADGKKTTVSEEHGPAAGATQLLASEMGDLRWLVQHVTFPSHARTTIRVSYEAKYNYTIHGRYAVYDYSTGSYWKDAIGLAAFTIDCREIGRTKDVDVSVTGRIRARKLITENAVMYEVRNLKPGRLDFMQVRIRHGNESRLQSPCRGMTGLNSVCSNGTWTQTFESKDLDKMATPVAEKGFHTIIGPQHSKTPWHMSLTKDEHNSRKTVEEFEDRQIPWNLWLVPEPGPDCKEKGLGCPRWMRIA